MINFALVGVGHIAKKHKDAIEKTDGAALVAVCDTNPERLEEYKDYQTYTDLDEMLKVNDEIDVVNICVPSGLHYPLTKIVAEHKRHIIVEKPMALTLEETEKMQQVAEENGVKLAVVHPNRFRPAVQKLRKAIDDGLFGKISHANATVRWNRNQAYYDQAPWRGTEKYDGGVLMNQAIHDLDLMLWLMGPVESVQGMAATRLRNIETEDVATAVVRFKSGALGVIEAATTIYPTNLEESLSIFGEKATAKIGGKTANYIQTWNIEGITQEEVLALQKEIEKNPFGKPGHQWIIEDMVKAIEEDREPIVSAKDGIAPIQLILAILESSKTGKAVKIN
ncbi:Gfo/Idh/MocA family protein [Pseudalkalibacillus sp. R45]|uniref:Gfo/Idh/MocA family protein n=1 Tax=Pseudalkalibacillus sp. R45 TaxID=3457433 RepID=UPI003FCE96CE